VPLNISGVGGAGGAAELFGWIAAVRFLPLAMT
jgi:phosphoribosylcarboxyaminoimidazole (NCAIR) mutase